MLSQQKANYNIDLTLCKWIMKDINIKNVWEEYFESNENIWLDKLNQVK